MTVHFNIHMDPAKGATSAGDIADVLKQEILSSNVTGSVLGDLVVDIDTLEIQGENGRSVLLPCWL